MPNENNAVSDFLNDLGSNDLFAEKEPETTESAVEDTAVEDEKPLPFHRDPKVQRYVEKQIEKALKDKPQSQETQFRKDIEEIQLPDSFVELIGNDTPEKRRVLKDMSDYFMSLPQKAKEQFVEEQRAEAQRQAEADVRAQEELDTYFDEIEENYGVDLSSNSTSAKQTRAQFIDYVRKIAPKDENGEVTGFPDLLSAFEVFQQVSQRSAQPSRAKELASRGMTRSGDTDSSTPRGNTWKDADKFFEQLKANN